MSKFDSPTTEVLYRISLDGTAEVIGDVTTFGSVHHGLGRVTRSELETNFDDVLREVGVCAHDLIDNAFWIVHEDDQGFVSASGFISEAEYRAEIDELERRWSAFDSVD